MASAIEPAVPRVTVDAATADEVASVVEPLFREYGDWVAERLAADAGIAFTAGDLERHHAAFRAELPGLLGPRGRLLLARLDGAPVGVGALKPVDDETAEIKRMYVRPAARGFGAGRSLLDRLVGDAAVEGYTWVRLETLTFMTAAQAMYRAWGFTEQTSFEGSETAGTGLERLTIFMRLDLGRVPE